MATTSARHAARRSSGAPPACRCRARRVSQSVVKVPPMTAAPQGSQSVILALLAPGRARLEAELAPHRGGGGALGHAALAARALLGALAEGAHPGGVLALVELPLGQLALGALAGSHGSPSEPVRMSVSRPARGRRPSPLDS